MVLPASAFTDARRRRPVDGGLSRVRVVRFVLVAAAAAIVACRSSAPGPGDGAGVEGRVDVTGDVAVQRGAGGSATASDVHSDTVRFGSQGSQREALLVVPQAPVQARCVLKVELVLQITDGRGEFALYPGEPAIPVSQLAEGQPLDPATVLDSRPRSLVTVTGPGPARWDITELYTRWARGGPFPAKGDRVPDRAPLVLDLRSPVPGSPDALAFTSADARSPARPFLAWSARRGCAVT